MKKILLVLFLGILISNNTNAKSYKTGDKVIDEFIVSKKYKVDIPGEWTVIYRKSWDKYGFTTNFYGLGKVEDNELLEWVGIMEDKVAGMYVGWIDNWINQVQFKDKYDGCYERPEYYLTEVIQQGSAHNCFQVGHLDLYKEMYNPDSPHGRASVYRFKSWIEDSKIKYSQIMLWSYHSYFSRMVTGNWVTVSRLANPKIYNAPKSMHLSEETSEYHKYNIDNFPEHQKIMDKWLSLSAENHIIFENNSRTKPKHKLDLGKYITHKNNAKKDNNSFIDQIKKLNDLYKSGILSKEEFEKAKKRILNN